MLHKEIMAFVGLIQYIQTDRLCGQNAEFLVLNPGVKGLRTRSICVNDVGYGVDDRRIGVKFASGKRCHFSTAHHPDRLGDRPEKRGLFLGGKAT
jgi:hypothetical protein